MAADTCLFTWRSSEAGPRLPIRKLYPKKFKIKPEHLKRYPDNAPRSPPRKNDRCDA